ncbi:MAG: ribonuclease HII, partial [Candidatus Levybacteria bacterium]|nr:ribonuclease HII [Candidatus Levybacteria bacterium]
ENINDSKLLKPKLREELSGFIKSNSIWAIESVEIGYINQYGIGKANIAVFRKVLKTMLKNFNDLNHFILIDGFHKRYLPGGIKKQKAIIKEDRKSISIASASIIAKVYRDNLMREASNTYPNYNFEQNKGYGTLAHRSALKTYGACDFHRNVFISNNL